MTFIASKILWFIAAPLNLFAILLFLAAVGARKKAERARRRHGGVLFLSLLLLAFAFAPMGDWLMMPLENRFPTQLPARVDGIILLAGSESPVLSAARNYPAVGVTAERYLAFAELTRKYPEAKRIFVGGSNSLRRETETIANGDIAKTALTAIGVDTDGMMFESQSRNTYENAVQSAQMAKPQPNENWLLVTSAYHMPRSFACFKKAGWRVFPVTVDYKTTGVFSAMPDFNVLRQVKLATIALREYVGLIAYKMMGRIDGVWE